MTRRFFIPLLSSVLMLFSSQTFAQVAPAEGSQTFAFFEDWAAAASSVSGNVTIDTTFSIEETVRPDEAELDAFIEVPSPTLTFPWGTLFAVDDEEGNPGLFQVNQYLFDLSNLIGISVPQITDTRLAFQVEQPVVIVPNPELGFAVGFTATDLNGLNPELTTIQRYDNRFVFYENDEVLGELIHFKLPPIDNQPENISEGFIAPPGRHITRVEVILNKFDISLPGYRTTVMGMMFSDTLDVDPEPEPEPTTIDALADIASDVDALIESTTDNRSIRRLEIAQRALELATQDALFEEDGNRLSRFGGAVFSYSTYAIYFLQRSRVDGSEELVDRILSTLESIVDKEIDYAITNGGSPRLIDRAEDLVNIAQFIDEDLDNQYVAAIAYRIAWVNAYFATY